MTVSLTKSCRGLCSQLEGSCMGLCSGDFASNQKVYDGSKMQYMSDPSLSIKWKDIPDFEVGSQVSTRKIFSLKLDKAKREGLAPPRPNRLEILDYNHRKFNAMVTGSTWVKVDEIEGYSAIQPEMFEILLSEIEKRESDALEALKKTNCAIAVMEKFGHESDEFKAEVSGLVESAPGSILSNINLSTSVNVPAAMRGMERQVSRELKQAVYDLSMVNAALGGEPVKRDIRLDANSELQTESLSVRFKDLTPNRQTQRQADLRANEINPVQSKLKVM